MHNNISCTEALAPLTKKHASPAKKQSPLATTDVTVWTRHVCPAANEDTPAVTNVSPTTINVTPSTPYVSLDKKQIPPVGKEAAVSTRLETVIIGASPSFLIIVETLSRDLRIIYLKRVKEKNDVQV
ncbi:MAG: hypothetical protein GY950_11960 [bacterium]|nr:hypothetical protein [bacterium]